MEAQTLEEALKEAWQETLAEFYYPLLHNQPEIVPHIEGIDTAHFDFRTNKTIISQKFISMLIEMGLDAKTAIKGIQKHEVGHYVHSPRDKATLLYLGDMAKSMWEQKGATILNYFMDAQVNLEIMLQKEGGKPTRQIYKAMREFVQKQIAQAHPAVKTILEKESELDELMTAIYQMQAEEDFGVGDIVEKYQKLIEKCERMLKQEGIDPTTDKENYEKEKRNKMYCLLTAEDDAVTRQRLRRLYALSAVDYAIQDPDKEWGNAFMFGEIIKDLIPEKLGIAAHGHNGFEINDLSEDQINEGLDEIIRKYGKARYDRIRKFVEAETGRIFDQKRPKNSGNHAGTDSSKLERHDDQISWYERRARTHGLYIVRKPLIVEVNDAYPQENIEFVVGDEMKRWNRFQAGGKLLPGISKKKRDEPMKRKDRKFKVPDLFICLDTSGSMAHPDSGSHAVLASFILARNYHKNDVRVGVMNFSADSAFLMPTRDLEATYSMLCSYWGGGTVLDTEKIRQYFDKLAQIERGRRMPEFYASTEEDYKRLLERLPESERKQFEKKTDIEVKTPERRAVCEKLDNIMITDGGIANLPEVVSYLNELGQATRNTIFIIGNENEAKRWQELNLSNTQVVSVAEPKDLEGLAIGKVRKLIPASGEPRSAFYR